MWEKWFATEDIPYPFGVIKAGTVAAVRFEIRGWVNGEPRIIVEHCNRVTNDAAPDWPRATSAENDCYRVIIKGSPNITQETLFRDEFTGDANAGGCLSTGMRAVNAIPAVMAARRHAVAARPAARARCGHDALGLTQPVLSANACVHAFADGRVTPKPGRWAHKNG